MQGDEEHNQVSDDPNDNYTNCEIDVKGDDAETELKIFQWGQIDRENCAESLRRS